MSIKNIKIYGNYTPNYIVCFSSVFHRLKKRGTTAPAYV